MNRLISIEEPKESKLNKAKSLLNRRLSSEGYLQAQPSEWNIIFQQPLWSLAFRPWFLLASVLSVASLVVWILFLNGIGKTIGGLSATIWHIHEMLFGFAATVAAAFLLTAVQTWTGLRSLHGRYLVLLTLLWLMVRVLIWSGNSTWQWWAMFAQGLWWLGCIAVLARCVLKTNNRRNYIFVPLLLAMMLLNMSVLYADLSGHTDLALHLSRTMVLLFGLLVGIVGGRVIPFFTKNRIAGAVINETPVITGCLLLSSFLGVVVFASGFFTDLWIGPAILMVIAGLLHLWRLVYWRSWDTRREPLLWSLHGAYLLLAIGLVALGMSYFVATISFSDALHLITVGTIGGMVLAMMARVSLGHTGRPLVVGAFLCLFAAALLRFIFSLLQLPLMAWGLSSTLWVTAFIVFISCYGMIFFRPRQ